ncbi:MAG: hypothetical protein KDC92_09070 [Bacteroidetes bacterium]|nr:hypothetical protein [Bacteroidota bacterium]
MEAQKIKEIYTTAIKNHPLLELKGKNMLYTSLNGHMHTTITKEGEMGIRLAKEDRKAYEDKYGPSAVISYGATLREYVKINDEVLANQNELNELLTKSLNYIKTLEPKPTKKPK